MDSEGTTKAPNSSKGHALLMRSGSVSEDDEEETAVNAPSSSGQDSASAIPTGGVRWSSDETASSLSTSRTSSPPASTEGGSSGASSGEEGGKPDADMIQEPEEEEEDEEEEDLEAEEDRGPTSTEATGKKKRGEGPEGGEQEQEPPLKKAKSADADDATICTTDAVAEVEMDDKEAATASGSKDDKDAKDTGHDKDDRSLLNDMQRRLRNAREKRRSGKICDQFDHIRDTMVAAGVIVPKGTKGTILAAAKEYIAMLQEQQRRILLDNCLLVHQVQKIGEGALGPSASTAVRQVAAKNGIASMIWPNNGSGSGANANNNSSGANNTNVTTNTNDSSDYVNPTTMTKVTDYSAAFRNCPVAMGIATLGGSFMDCNDQFCQMTNCTKEQVLKKTIFSLVDQQDLHSAFDQISTWLNGLAATGIATGTTTAAPQQPIVLRSNLVAATTQPQSMIRVCLTPIRDQTAMPTTTTQLQPQQPATNSTLRYLCVTLLQDSAQPPCMAATTTTTTTIPFALPAQAAAAAAASATVVVQDNDKTQQQQANASQMFTIG